MCVCILACVSIGSKKNYWSQAVSKDLVTHKICLTHTFLPQSSVYLILDKISHSPSGNRKFFFLLFLLRLKRKLSPLVSLFLCLSGLCYHVSARSWKKWKWSWKAEVFHSHVVVWYFWYLPQCRQAQQGDTGTLQFWCQDSPCFATSATRLFRRDQQQSMRSFLRFNLWWHAHMFCLSVSLVWNILSPVDRWPRRQREE